MILTARLVLVLSLLGLAGAPGCDKQRTESNNLVNEGVRAINRGAHDAAFSYFLRATKLWPENARAHYEMALVSLYDKKDRTRGIASLERAEKLSPNHRDILYHLGRNLVTDGDTKRGLLFLERAIKEDPNYAPAWYHRGVGLVKTKDYRGADTAFRETVTIDPNYTPGFVDLGELYERFDARDAAAAVYAEGLRHSPAAPDLLNAQGILKMQLGKPAEAAKIFERAVTIGGGRTDAVFNLAFAYVELGDARRAYRYLGEFVNSADSAKDAENIRVALLVRDAMIRQLTEERRNKQAKDADEGPKKQR